MPGVEIDPVTLQPKDPVKVVSEREAREKKRLEELASHVGISQSQAAQTMAALLEEALLKRVEVVLANDEACKVLLDVLKAVGNIEISAAQATKRLVTRQTHNPRSVGPRAPV